MLGKCQSFFLFWVLSIPFWGVGCLWMWRCGAPSTPLMYGYAFMLAVSCLMCSGMYILMRRSDRRRAAPGCCRSCGRNLTGVTSGVCPECGATVPSQVRAEPSEQAGRGCLPADRADRADDA